MTEETQEQGQATPSFQRPTVLENLVVMTTAAISAGTAAGMASHDLAIGCLTAIAVFTALMIIRTPHIE